MWLQRTILQNTMPFWRVTCPVVLLVKETTPHRQLDETDHGVHFNMTSGIDFGAFLRRSSLHGKAPEQG